MRHALAALLALFALAPACQDEPGVGDSGTIDDRPRGERCDEMQACGRMECWAEIVAVHDCGLAVDGCSGDPDRFAPLQTALAECLDAAACNTTSCDLVAALTDDKDNLALHCDADGDAELLDLALSSMFTTDPDDEEVAACQALE
jgi:hypothetical protein